jgi:PIN domain nuclease of toxin-antitoxin system
MRPTRQIQVQRVLFDTSAVLAYLNHEPGWEAIEPLLLSGQTAINTVNMTEVISKLCDFGMGIDEATVAFKKLAMPVLPFTTDMAIEAARLRPLTKALGLSLGDRACLACARCKQLPVVTGDRPWLTVAADLGLEIRSIRPDSH